MKERFDNKKGENMTTSFEQKLYFSPFESYAKYNGKHYTIIRQLDKTEVDEEAGNVFKIMFDDGEIIEAFQEELDGDYEEAMNSKPNPPKRPSEADLVDVQALKSAADETIEWFETSYVGAKATGDAVAMQAFTNAIAALQLVKEKL
jgi:hypothetical protein